MSSPGMHDPAGAHDPLRAPAGFSLVEFSTRRRVTVAMMTLTLVLFGLIGLSSLKVNLLPDLSYPTLTVRTDYTGAAPTEVETLISEPAEEALGVVKGLRKLKSISRTGQSDVVLEFAWGTDMDQASLDVRDKMESLQFPLEAAPPVLLRFNPSTQPIMRLALSPKTAGSDAEAIRQLMELRRFADDDLKRKLETVDGVAAVKVGGGLEDEIQVDIDQRKLSQLGLTLDNVVQRLQQENINVSGGRLEEGSQRYLVRTVNQFATVDEIANMLLTTRAAAASNSGSDQAMRVAAASGDTRVMAALSQQGSASDSAAGGMALRLKDVAEVRQGYKEREAIIRIDGREAVEMAIYKEGDANTVSTADALETKLADIRAKLPPDIEADHDRRPVGVHPQCHPRREGRWRDRWPAVDPDHLPVPARRLEHVRRSACRCRCRSSPRSSSWIGWGLSLNVMSLGGLALATGLVVDDSIVVLESIAKARERGLGILDAAIAGTREVSMAVVASTLTTIAVFLPLVFVQGIAGQLFRDQALTVAIAIAVSLVVAMTLIPMLSALKGRPPLGFPEEAGARALGA